MLKILVRVEEKFTRIELDQDAGHRPDVAFLIPSLVFEDYFRCAVLSSVDHSGVSLVLIGGTAEVNYFDLAAGHFVPLTTQLLLALAREIARVVIVAALLAAIDTPLVLHLLEKSFKVRELWSLGPKTLAFRGLMCLIDLRLEILFLQR